MSLFGSKDWANNAPKYAVAGGNGIAANGNVLFGNATSYGTFGVDPTEAGILSGEGKRVQHAGWQLRVPGTGPVINVTQSVAGANYRSNGFIVFYGGGGTGANASYTVNTTTNTITTITLNNGGSGYTSAPTANAANATGVNSAVFSVTTGGRSGRVRIETLVAMGSMTGDGSDDTLFPDS